VEGSIVSGESGSIDDDVPIHRIGGGSVENLSLKPAEVTLVPPGISTFAGGPPAEAAEIMRQYFPRMAVRGMTVVGTTTAAQIRQAGFDVIMNPTRRFLRHARLIHPAGASGFTRENLERLAECFDNHPGL
jgi:hypothetical protein